MGWPEDKMHLLVGPMWVPCGSRVTLVSVPTGWGDPPNHLKSNHLKAITLSNQGDTVTLPTHIDDPLLVGGFP